MSLKVVPMFIVKGFGFGFGFGFTETFGFWFRFRRNRKSGFVGSLFHEKLVWIFSKFRSICGADVILPCQTCYTNWSVFFMLLNNSFLCKYLVSIVHLDFHKYTIQKKVMYWLSNESWIESGKYSTTTNILLSQSKAWCL